MKGLYWKFRRPKIKLLELFFKGQRISSLAKIFWIPIFLKTIKRIKLLEEEHARHQIICNPELHSGLYGRKLTRRAQPRRTATKRRKISSNQNKEFNSEEKPEPIKPLPSHEKYIPPIQVCILDDTLYRIFF